MTDSHHPPLWELLGLNEPLRRAALELLPLSADPLSPAQCQACWNVDQETADQWRQELCLLEILLNGDQDRLTMPWRVREKLLWMLVDDEPEESVRQMVQQWLRRHVEQRQPLLAAWAFDLLADLSFCQADSSAVIRALRCSITLRRTHGDVRGQATRCWSLGAYLMRHGRRAEGQAYIEQAIAMADDLGLRQAHVYRRRLAEMLADEENV